MGKLCPILNAGKDHTHLCMKESCEWYEHGCPAYPKHIQTQEEIDEQVAGRSRLQVAMEEVARRTLNA